MSVRSRAAWAQPPRTDSSQPSDVRDAHAARERNAHAANLLMAFLFNRQFIALSRVLSCGEFMHSWRCSARRYNYLLYGLRCSMAHSNIIGISSTIMDEARRRISHPTPHNPALK